VGCDPNFLGHASLATTDIAIVAGMLVLVYHFYHGQERGWARRVLVPGLCFGLAILAKASGMMFGMQAVFVLGVYRLVRNGSLVPPTGCSFAGRLIHLWHASFSLRKDITGIALIGFALVFAYTGSDWETEWTFIAWADELPEGPAKAIMVPVSHNLAIFPNAGEGLIQQIKHNLRGHGTYVLGAWHPRAYWAYFPVALTMKLPLAIIALLLGAMVFRLRALNTPIGWLALLLLVFSLTCRVQIGIRFMFTLMTVAYIAAAVAVTRGWERNASPVADTSCDGPKPGEWARGLMQWFVGAAIVSTAVTTVWVWPHGLSYFNQLWGGPEMGYTRLHDSNFDWGQGLPELKQWHAAQGNEQPLAVWYYGTDPAILLPPFRWAQLSHAKLATGDDVPKAVGGRYLAVSVSILYGNPDATPATRLAIDWLQARRPMARTHTFVIYDLQS
jgi:hypothetical protein